MKRRYHLLSCLAAVLACLLSFAGCEPDDVRIEFAPEQGAEAGQTAWADMPLTIAAALGEGPETKASLLKDVEAKGSGALVLVFRSATRQLESYRFFSQDELAAQGQVPLSLRVPLAECDFYILGNLNGIRKSDGSVLNLMDALGAAFPVEENGLESMIYRLDGGDLNGICRRETFAEVAAQGIPYALIRKNVNTLTRINEHKGIPDSDHCRRLFSKVTVRIDHAAFDGSGAHPEFFVNSHLYLRQANGRLQPFSDSAQKALEAADVLAQSDYDPDMSSTNASVTTFSFYVPENMQGTLLPGNTDSRLKTRDELLARNLSAVEPYLTYVEFAGQLDPAAGGYGGGVTYRFYVGNDNCSNFDLERGREYAVSLTFRVGSLFDPDWKVEPDHWSDGRLFCLTADPGFTTDIGIVNEDRMVAVRKSRPGSIYIYMNPQRTMGATNLLLGKDVSATPNFIPADLSDCSWYGDLMKNGTEDAAWLAARGITASWDKTTGRLKLEVTDAALFDAHRGETAREFTLSLLPGGTVSTRFKIGLYDDLTLNVADGKSLSDGFYLGQKRTVSVSGFAGSAIKYAAVQEKCGASPSAVQNANVQWKAGLGGNFPTCAVDGAGRLLLDVSNAAYAAQTYTGSLDVYAFYPNCFQPGHAGWASKDGRIVFFSEDYLNDSAEVTVRISEPKLKAPSAGPYVLPIDGNEVATDGGYYDYAGTARLEDDQFDPTLRASLLGISLTVGTGTLGTRFPDGFAFNGATGEMYVCKTQNGAGKMEEQGFNENSVGIDIENCRLANPALPDLYPGTDNFKIRLSRLSIRSFSAPSSGETFTKNEANKIYTYYLGNYYKSSCTDLERLQLSNKISVSMKYNFANAAIDDVVWDRLGPARTYSCSSGEQIGPVIDYVVKKRDTGNGGEISWVFDETNQKTQSASGEWVPGALCVPYGVQTVKGTYRNKWDGREISASLDFTIYHNLFGLVTFVGAGNAPNATVYICTWKAAKVLRTRGTQLTPAARQWVLKSLSGTDYIRATFNGMYQYVDGASGTKFKVSSQVSIPASNFDVQYYSSGASRWTASLADALNGTQDGSGAALSIFPTSTASLYSSDVLNHQYLPEYFQEHRDPAYHYANAPRFALYVSAGF